MKLSIRGKVQSFLVVGLAMILAVTLHASAAATQAAPDTSSAAMAQPQTGTPGGGPGGRCGGNCGCAGKGMGRMAAGPVTPLNSEVRQAIETALADEIHAESFYMEVMEDLGEVRPFSRIVMAERRHAASLVSLLERRDLPVPEPAEFDQEVNFADRQEACTAAIQAEIDNVAIYDGLMGLDLPVDVQRVFEHNRMASQEHHLPAFERCAEGRASRYGR